MSARGTCLSDIQYSGLLLMHIDLDELVTVNIPSVTFVVLH